MKGAVCVASTKIEDRQCYQCVEEQVTCGDIGLLRVDECAFCEEIPDTECIETQGASESLTCYQCVKKN